MTPPRMRSGDGAGDRDGGHAGFTLVELLVVVAILSMLIALLLPSLRRSRDVAMASVCQSNLRQIMSAARVYATDNFDTLPYPNWREEGAHGWLYSDLQMDKLEHLETGLLWPYLKTYGVYRCPADKVDPWEPGESFMESDQNVPNRPNNSRMITSYCMNGSVYGYGALGGGKDGHYRTYSLGSFQADDVIFWPPDENKAGGWWWDGANFPWEGISGRHTTGANLVSVDGHTEWITLDKYYNVLAPRNPDQPTRLWNRPGSDTGR